MPTEQAVVHSRSSTGLLLAGSVVVPAAIVVGAVVVLGDSGYAVLNRGYPGVETSLASALLRLVADLAGALCLGALVVAAFVVPRAGRDRLRLQSGEDLAPVRWASGVWTVVAVALAVVDSADANGVPLTRLLEPGALGYLAQASYLPAAWIVTAALAFVVFCAANIVQTWMASVALAALSVVALLAPVLVTQVLVGPNHDFGGDAAIFATPALAVWVGATVTVTVRWRTGRLSSPPAVGRFRRLSIVCAVTTATGMLIVGAFELAGGSPFATPTGWLFLIQFALLGVLGVLGAFGTSRFRSSSPPRSTRPPKVLLGAAGIQLVIVGVSVVMTRIPPPQYFVPTSIMQLFLGFDVTAAPTLDVLVGAWRINLLFAVISLSAIALYLIGVRRLQRRGDAWPPGRTIVWVLGWLVIFATTSSGLGKYSSVSFSLHMVLHMSLNMLGPLLLVMGGPITLALRAISPRRRGEPAGVHEWITGLLNWSTTRSMLNPLWVFATFVGSYYLIYLTPIFEEAMRYHWSHQLMNLHFLVGGYLFYSLVIGVDHPPRPLPHIGKLGLVLAAMPFHAFFGVIIMTSTTVIAQTFYDYIRAPWMTDLAADQYLGGGIAWSAGELPLIVVVIALVTQWSRQDARTAARTDRHLDGGLDDSFDAYNDMLTRLGNRSTTTLSGAAPARDEPR